ncbi:MAG: membrane lipoprotein lipid attachment site-containing protein [Bacillota bacterium]
MRKSLILIGAAVVLAGCGRSGGNDAAANNAAANSAAAEKPKPAYCFFKDAETKGWKASVDKSGNVVVSGKAYRQDSRYKALLSPATVNGDTAVVAPTIGPNDTGYAAPGDWWDVSETIPNSSAVSTVTVKCGDETLATLTVPRRK